MPLIRQKFKPEVYAFRRQTKEQWVSGARRNNLMVNFDQKSDAYVMLLALDSEDIQNKGLLKVRNSRGEVDTLKLNFDRPDSVEMIIDAHFKDKAGWPSNKAIQLWEECYRLHFENSQKLRLVN